MNRHRRSSWILAIGILLAARLAAVVVSIERPTFLEPVVGEVVVVASVESRQPVETLVLFVDGSAHAILDSPPYRWVVDVGEQNLEHTFRVVVTVASGETGEVEVTTPKLEIDENLDVELQQLYVTVGRNGNSVENLTRSQFMIEDNGERQEVVTFELGDIPLTAVVLLDVSSSMGGTDLDLALSSSRAFIGGLQPLDETMLLMFSDRVVRSTEFTGFTEILLAALSNVTATGATALNDHLYVGLKLLEPRQGRRVVLLLSDGIDSASALHMADVRRYADRSQALIYWLRLPVPGSRISSAWWDAEGYRKELSKLEDIVETSGGRTLELAGLAEADEAFAEVLRELRAQYVLGYYPTTRSDDGAWHSVKVRVPGSGLKVRCRRGYIDY